jgi:hypothetical protein
MMVILLLGIVTVAIIGVFAQSAGTDSRESIEDTRGKQHVHRSI